MSTYSPDLRIELITTGDQAGTWGTTTNTNLGTIIEDAISGYITVSVTSANQALSALDGTADEARNAMIRLTTTTTANFTVYAPPNSKQYIIWNNSGYTATISNATAKNGTTATGGATVTVANGEKAVVFSDGYNFFTVDPKLSGSVANGVIYANSANVITNGTALVFNGSSLGVGTSSPTSKLDVVASNFTGGPAIGARYNTSNARIGFNIANANGFPYIGYNANNVNGSDTPSYDLSQAAAQLRMDGGQFRFNIAPSGAANTTIISNGVSYTIITSGNQTAFGAANNNVGTVFTATSSGTLSSGTVSQNITFTQAMVLDASSNLGIGVTPSGVAKLEVAGGGLLQGLTVSTGGGLNSANTATFDTNGAGVARFYSRGTNTATVGSFQWRLASSNGSIDNLGMSMDTSGNLAIAGTSATINSVPVVTTTDAQTLSNKTINGSSNTITNVSLTSGITGTLAVGNGGTGATTAAGARTSLDVPSTSGSGATGTWGINISGNATTVTNGVYTTGTQTIGGTKTFTSGITFNDATVQTTAMGWNVTYVNTVFSSGDTYTLPARCVGIYVYCNVSGAGNNGGVGRVVVRDSGVSTLGTMNINGTNINQGPDGGSGMVDSAGSFVPISSNAVSVLFEIVSNLVGGSFTLQAYVTR